MIQNGKTGRVVPIYLLLLLVFSLGEVKVAAAQSPAAPSARKQSPAAPSARKQSPAAPSAKNLNVFQLPAFQHQQVIKTLPVLQLHQQGRFQEAEEQMRKLLETAPRWPDHAYNLAAILAKQDKTTEAFSMLKQSIELGFNRLKLLNNDPDLKSLRQMPQFGALVDQLSMKLKTSPKAKPYPVQNGVALVSTDNTQWLSKSQILLTQFSFEKHKQPASVYGGKNQLLKRLNVLYESGDAAGNHGDLYDNRDAAHSPLSKTLFPQMSHIEYSTEAIKAKLQFGAASLFLFNQITLGNSSTALTKGLLWRSQARSMLTTTGMPKRLYRQYSNNHLYIYPEHRDHDLENGDLFPANTPYQIISQGSSGSDQVFLQASSAILAALRPEVKEFLRNRKLVAPTVQMILRSGMNGVRIKRDYLSGRAHPSVFDGKEINYGKMISIAQSIKIEDVPPKVILSVVEESKVQPGYNYFGPSVRDEVLFTTPSAIARVARSTEYERKMVIHAGQTQNPGSKPLKFIWRVLRGDSQGVSINPTGDNGATAEIRVKWHGTKGVPGDQTIKTNRVDIGVFADNGTHYSAPAFISFTFPPKQKRIYDIEGRLQEIDYNSKDFAGKYEDPALFAKRNWKDRYHYTENGKLRGWDRQFEASTSSYTRHGARVVEIDNKGRAIKAEQVRYRLESIDRVGNQIVEIPSGRFLAYEYDNDADLLGRVRRCANIEC